MNDAGIGNANSQPPTPSWGIPPAQQSGAPILLGSSPNKQ
jgi:hypothetical protein